MDVAAWLQSLGLGQYETMFRDNDVDASVLANLTADDLRELGVASLGHRRKLLAAIATLGGIYAGPSALPAVAGNPVRDLHLDRDTEDAGLPGGPMAGAERRQITVIFCDLAGSTALSVRLDPEDLRTVIGAYHRAVAVEIERRGGTVAKYMGDGVLAYFGWPAAGEDDAERAVCAGLAAAAAVDALRLPGLAQPLAARIGIATGEVVVGDLLGGGMAQERAAIGETPNLAARLQGLAEPGVVLACGTTRRLTGTLFAWDALAPRTLKGFAGPIVAFRVLGESGIESRFEALRSGVTAPMIGRGEELDLLLRRWHQASAGEGQVVLLRGEAGIGKSRLIQALREALGTAPCEELILFCSAQHADSTLRPVIARLERTAGLAPSDAPETRLAKLEALMLPLDPPAEDVALIAELLAVPTLGRWPVLEFSPQRRRERLLLALQRRVRSLAACRPVLMVVEDTHWLDPTTRELLDLLVADMHAIGAVLLVMTHRPEFDLDAWVGLHHVSLVQLKRLAPAEYRALLQRVAGGRALPPEVEAEVLARTDGVPLFVEEVGRAVLESGLLRQAADRWVLEGALPPLAVPSTLQASLVARLDRLASVAFVREVAQAGAVIGREFTHDVLATVAGLPPAQLDEALAKLEDAGLLQRRGRPPQATYIFKHALIQDAAYGTLLRERRWLLHRRAAEALEELRPWIATQQPELLARHCLGAGLDDRAASLLEAAGRQALARSSQREAVSHLRKVDELVRRLPADQARPERKLRVLLALGQGLFGVQGPTTETLDTFEEALKLARATGSEEASCHASYGIHSQLTLVGEFRRARDLGLELEMLFDRHGWREAAICSGRMLGTTLYHMGDLAGADARLRRAIDVFETSGSLPRSTVTYAHHPGLTAPAARSVVLWALGQPEQAVGSAARAIEQCRNYPEANSLAYCLQWAMHLHLALREHEQVLRLANEAMLLAEERGSEFWRIGVTWAKGAALIQAGEVAEGRALLGCGLRAFMGHGGLQNVPFKYCIEAEGCSAAGDLEGWEVALTAGREIALRTDQVIFLPELHRLTALLLLRRGRHGEAEKELRRGIAVARSYGARAWELRGATSLARLIGAGERRASAAEVMSPVVAGFTEGLSFRDLAEACVLLEELGGTRPGPPPVRPADDQGGLGIGQSPSTGSAAG